MKDWAAGDVQAIFDLFYCQVREASTSAREKARKISQISLAWRSASLSYVRVHRPGLFIGRRGVQLRALERRTGTLVQNAPGGSRGYFMVYHRSKSALAKVEHAAETC